MVTQRILEFGRREPGVEYRDRPGAYGVLFDAAGRVAVVRTPRGHYLPGGGLEPGEAPEDGLRREVREECGCEIAITRPLGVAAQYVYSRGHESGWRKVGSYFVGRVTDDRDGAAVGTEPGHELCWLEPRIATTLLFHESQSWAVRRALAGH